MVPYFGQRYILYNWRCNSSGVYSPNLVEGEFRELRHDGVLGSSSTARKKIFEKGRTNIQNSSRIHQVMVLTQIKPKGG
jgi:hypothetical protein